MEPETKTKDRLLLLGEACERTGYGLDSARKFVRKGGNWSPFSVKLGRAWRVSEIGLSEWIEAKKKAVAA